MAGLLGFPLLLEGGCRYAVSRYLFTTLNVDSLTKGMKEVG